MPTLESLKVKLFADGADLDGIRSLAALTHIKGFTTNPSLMKKAGVKDYKSYAQQAFQIIGDRPISLEVFADDLPGMAAQARIIAGWGANVYVKIPVRNTLGHSTAPVIEELSAAGVKLNVTAVFTARQVAEVTDALAAGVPAVISVFAGRMADVGVDPVPVIVESRLIVAAKPKAELLWAATREVFNVVEAERLGCHIITVPNDILGKLKNLGRSVEDACTDTVAGFFNDAQSAGFTIE